MEARGRWERTSPAPGVRMVHLGLGAFHKAHQAWYTDRANAAGHGAGWGIAAFTGRRPGAARALAPQDGLFTLLTRGPDGDEAATVESIVAAHDGSDGTRWRALLADPAVAVVTLTVTEAGYRRGADGDVDLADADVAADVALLREHTADEDASHPAARTAPGRLVDGLRARRDAAGGPVAVVSCDNLPENGVVTRAVVRSLAAEVEPALVGWVDENVSFVSTMVDRITPATTDADREAVRRLTGRDDAAPVVTEPFAEWVLEDSFPAGRPTWEVAGARLVADVGPYEQRKLWLLNAGHSLLAYTGLPRGHATVAEAFADPACRRLLEQLWDDARPVLPLPADEVDEALSALRSRFTNPRIEHRLAQIAADGSHKLPVRVLAVGRARRAAGLPVTASHAAVLAAWAHHLTAGEGTRTDPAAADLAAALHTATTPGGRARLLLATLAPDLQDEPDVLASLERALADRPQTPEPARPASEEETAP